MLLYKYNTSTVYILLYDCTIVPVLFSIPASLELEKVERAVNDVEPHRKRQGTPLMGPFFLPNMVPLKLQKHTIQR